MYTDDDYSEVSNPWDDLDHEQRDDEEFDALRADEDADFEHDASPESERVMEAVKKAQYLHMMLAKIIAAAYVNASDKETCFSTLYLLLSELEANNMIVGAADIMEMAQVEIFHNTSK